MMIWTPRDVYEAAKRCEDAYREGALVGEGENRGVQVIVSDDGEHVAIAGTNDIWDGLDDLDPREELGMRRGFLDHARRVRSVLSRSFDLSEVRTISGHSLGGAAAVCLLALDASENHRLRRAKVFTFGAPRALTRRAYFEFFRSRVLRVERSGDLVPCLPPAIRGWRHVGEHLRYGGSVPWRLLAKLAFSKVAALREAADAHSISEYVKDAHRHADSKGYL